MKLFLDHLRRNENAKVIIGFPKVGSPGVRESITAYITEEVTIGGSAMYSEPGDEVFNGITSLANEALNNLGAIAAGVTGTGFINRQVKTLWSTIATWTNTEKLIFSLTLKMYATDKTEDVRVPVRRFLECVNPIFDTEVPAMIQAPNAYDYTAKTCLSVKIGKWFKTPPIFLVLHTNWNFSKETITGGNPLYAEGIVKFQSYRQLSSKEVSEFLTGSFTGSADYKTSLSET